MNDPRQDDNHPVPAPEAGRGEAEPPPPRSEAARGAGSGDEGRPDGGGAERVRVGLWFGLLLLFVPVFYPLLYFRRYSWFARIGWGLWLGLIVFVKVAGLAEPVIDLEQIERELAEQEQLQQEQGLQDAPEPAAAAGASGAGPGAAGTFVQPDEAPPPPSLEEYLLWLGGGILGRLITEYAQEGSRIRLTFKPADWYFDSEPAIALSAIDAAYSLFYGRDYETVELRLTYRERPLRLLLERAAFNAHFGMTEAQMRALAEDRRKFAESPLTEDNLPPEARQAFFDRFAVYE